jgi:hydrophobic/amphiphilic exporter-1 (mainly G- bacteria), HAE1 family
MSISEICIKRPVFATVLNLVIIVLGVIFFSKLQIRGIPDIDPPIITVATSYPGADGLYMEREVTKRLETAFKTVKDIDFISSQSQDGSSNITLSFKLNTDIEIALNDVRSKISAISNRFPSDMAPPAASKLDSDAFPSIWIAVNTDMYDSMSLTRIVDDNIKSELEKLPSVGNANIMGGKFYTMRIEPDPIKLYQYRIAPTEIEAAILRQNNDYPAGFIKTEVNSFTLSLRASLVTPEEFGNIIIKKNKNSIIKLRDIAKVTLAPVENDTILRFNGKRAIALGVVKQSDANIIDLSKEVRAELEKIKKTLPQGVDATVAYDGAVSVDASIQSVFYTIVEALILVILVTYLFLGSFKITIIPLVTIPVSLIGTFSAMYLFGFSINIFTLLAIILAIGLVVDDAIVMMENVFRHNQAGQAPLEAAMSASKEISFAIVAMTITLASVFLPIGFIEGFLGKLFIEFAWTLAFCVLFSGFVALTLTPMMCSKMISNHPEEQSYIVRKFEAFIEYLNDKYIHYLHAAIAHKKKFLCTAGLASITILIISFIFVGKAFVPEEDDGIVQISFIGPEGSSYEASEKSVIEAEKILDKTPEVMGYFDVIGFTGSGDSGLAFVPLKDWSKRKKSQNEVRDGLNAQFRKIPGMSIFAMSPRSLASGNASKAIEFNLQSNLEYEEIDKISQNFIDKLKTYPMFQNIERDLKSSTPSLDITVNRDKAYLYDTSLDDIGNTVSYLIAGKKVGDFRMGNDIYDVILQYNLDKRNDVGSIKNIFIKTPNHMLPLETVATIEEKITIKSYNHYNNSRSVQISSDLAPSYKITDAIDAINETATKALDQATVKLEYLGEIQRMQEADSNFGITVLLALIFIYLVLSAQFESFTDPLLILLSVPFSITGGVLSLLISGNTVNMYSNIGLITLIGLITKNAIMIVEFANQLKEQGLKIHEAVIKSAQLRLRPILMTSFATVFGALPLVLASGAGAAARNSIGLVIVGGMMIGTLFTIFVIPALYSMKND